MPRLDVDMAALPRSRASSARSSCASVCAAVRAKRSRLVPVGNGGRADRLHQQPALAQRLRGLHARARASPRMTGKMAELRAAAGAPARAARRRSDRMFRHSRSRRARARASTHVDRRHRRRAHRRRAARWRRRSERARFTSRSATGRLVGDVGAESAERLAQRPHPHVDPARRPSASHSPAPRAPSTPGGVRLVDQQRSAACARQSATSSAQRGAGRRPWRRPRRCTISLRRRAASAASSSLERGRRRACG